MITTRSPLSPSQMEDLSCPRQFYHLRLDEKYKDLDRFSLPLQRGRDVHKILEEYQLHLKEAKRPTDYEWMRERVKAYEHPDGDVERDVAKLCRDFAQGDICDHEHTVPEWKVAVRREGDGFVSCDFDDPDAVFRGIFDRLIVREGSTEVWDFKTWYWMPPGSYLDRMPQTDIYSLLALTLRPKETKVRIVYSFLRYGNAQRPIEVYRDSEEPGGLYERVDAAEYYLSRRNRFLKAMEGKQKPEDAWPTVPTIRKCRTCAFPCPEKKALIKTSAWAVPTTEKAARSLVNKFIAGKAGVAELEKLLRGYCEDHGTAAGTGDTLGFSPVEKRSYTMQFLVENWEELQVLGVKLEALKVSGLSPYVKERKKDTPEVAAMRAKLREGAKVEVQSRFGEIK